MYATYTMTISGGTPEELYINLEAALKNRPGTNTAQMPQAVIPAAAAAPAAPVQNAAFSSPAPFANPMPAVPVAAPAYTQEQLARAGATLAQIGKRDEAVALLAKYNVPTILELKPDQYGAFATELRALGAQL